MSGNPHLALTIQPVGCLFSVTPDWIVSAVSENLSHYFDASPGTLIGQPLSSLFTAEAIHDLRNRLALLRGGEGSERLFRCPLDGGERHFDTAVHLAGETILIDAQPSSERAYGDVTGTVRGMVDRLGNPEDPAALLEEGARQVRALTGFDRVSIIRFADETLAEVVGESNRSGLEPRLGQTLADGAFPQDERALFRRSAVRTVTDVDADPVAIVGGGPLDLSLAVLRAGSPAEIARMRALDARSSMSIALMVDERPWGLIACSHAAPRCPGFERRAIAELFALIFAMRVERRLPGA